MKKTDTLLKVIFGLLAFWMIFAPLGQIASANSYIYDSWKNVIPSTEGLAHRETYYKEDLIAADGSGRTILMDGANDLAVYNGKIYIINSSLRETTVPLAGTSTTSTNVSELIILNEKMQWEVYQNEFLITDEVRSLLDEYYRPVYVLVMLKGNNYASARMFSDLNNAKVISQTDHISDSLADEIIDKNNTISKLPSDTVANVLDKLRNNEADFTIMTMKEAYLLTQGNADLTSIELVDKFDLHSWDLAAITADNFKANEIMDRAPYVPYSEDVTKAAIRLNSASGITVTKDGIYIADTNNARIIRLNENFVVDQVYFTPDDLAFYQVSTGLPLIAGEGFPGSNRRLFQPDKIAIDNSGKLYCLSRDTYEGILQYNPNATFNRYTGQNTVVASAWKKFWGKLFSDAQREQQALDLPPLFTNIAMDPNGTGALYATSLPDDEDPASSRLIKAINSDGKDILIRNEKIPADGDILYGTSARFEGEIIGESTLVGIAVNNIGNFTVVDSKRGKLFTYDPEGNLLYITSEQPGGSSNQGSSNNTSKSIVNPVAINYIYRDILDADGNHTGEQEELLIVLDRASQSMLFFELTEFGKEVNAATRLYLSGDVGGAEIHWRNVIKMNTNYELAYLGVGRSLYRQGNYEEAMRYFELANNNSYYSKAFSSQRDIILSKYFSWIMTGVILAIVGFTAYKCYKYIRKRQLGLIVNDDGGRG